MQRKFLVPVILAVVVILVLVGSLAYKQFNKSPFTDNEKVETLAPKPTDEIKQKSENGDSVRPTRGAGEGKELENGFVIIGKDKETDANGNEIPQALQETDADGNIVPPTSLSAEEESKVQQEVIDKYIKEQKETEIQTMPAQQFEEMQAKYRQEVDDVLSDPESRAALGLD